MIGQEYQGFRRRPMACSFTLSEPGRDLRCFISVVPAAICVTSPISWISPLAKHFNLMCFDQRGLGQSAKPAVEYTMADYADDAAALLDRVTDAPVRVIGVSYGGMVAQELALRYPEKIVRCCWSVPLPAVPVGRPFTHDRSSGACRTGEEVFADFGYSSHRRMDCRQPRSLANPADSSLSARRPDRDEVEAMK